MITINTCNARSDLALLNEIINCNPRNWRGNHLKDKFKGTDIFWLAGADLDACEHIEKHHTIFNRLPGVEAASSKDQLASIFN